MFKVVAIKGKGLGLSPAKLARAIDNAVLDAAKAAKVDFGVTTQTWYHQPVFAITKITGGYEVSTTDEIYGYVDNGTRPHIIRAKRAKTLAYNTPFRAKTRPRSIRSNVGSTGSTPHFPKVVHHPGTQAREFSETIKAKWDKQLPIIVQRAIRAEVK